MRPGRAVAASALACGAALVAGCGGVAGSASVSTDPGGVNNSAQPAAAELASAVTNLGAGTTLTTTLRQGASAEVLDRLLNQVGSKISPAEVASLAGTQVTIELSAPKGQTIGERTAGERGSSADLVVRSAATTYLEVRHVDQTLYLRLDLKDLLAAIGQSSRYAAIQTKASSLPGFVKSLVAGDWVSMPDDTLSLLQSLRGGGLGATPSPPATPSAGTPVDGIDALRTLLTHGTTVTRLSAGSTDRLAITAHARAIGAELLAVLRSAAPDGLGANGLRLGRLPRRVPAHVPNQAIRLSASIREGALSTLSVNLDQYGKRGAADVPLQVRFDRSGPAISAPSGAVSVDLSGLLGLAGVFGGTSASSSSA